jgi:1-acyl-sn-glycerol-3-phosphate acyltransferase
MQAFRYWPAFVALTLWQSAKAILAALLGVQQRPGGVYDRTAYQWATRLLAATRITVDVVGGERLRPDRPCVYIANHVSLVDIWALLATLPGTVRFVFKKELMRVPLFGAALRKAGHIRIDRQNRAAAFAAYDEAAAVIRRGTSAIVFAEGTRSSDGRLLPFKKGPFVLAIAAQAPVVPVLVEGGYELMRRGSLYPKRGTIRVVIGEDIPTEGLGYDDREELATRTRDALLALRQPPQVLSPKS